MISIVIIVIINTVITELCTPQPHDDYVVAEPDSLYLLLVMMMTCMTKK